MAKIHQVLVLTTNSTADKERLDKLQHIFKKKAPHLTLKPVYGVSFLDYDNMEAMMDAPVLGLTETQKEQFAWFDGHIFNRSNKDRPLNERKPTGPLACAIGHHYLWKLASEAPEGTWTVVLENDAMPLPYFSNEYAIEEAIGIAPPDADQVFLDDMHCQLINPYGKTPVDHGQIAQGPDIGFVAAKGTAYALTPRGGTLLRSQPFAWREDKLLNGPSMMGWTKEFCPEYPLLTASYDHFSTIVQGNRIGKDR